MEPAKVLFQDEFPLTEAFDSIEVFNFNWSDEAHPLLAVNLLYSVYQLKA